MLYYISSEGPVLSNGFLFFFLKERHGKFSLILYLQPCALMKPFNMSRCEGEGTDFVVQYLFDHTCRLRKQSQADTRIPVRYVCVGLGLLKLR